VALKSVKLVSNVTFLSS